MEDIIALLGLLFYYAMVLFIPAVFFFWVIKRYLFKYILSIEEVKKKRGFSIKLGLLLFCVFVIGIVGRQASLKYYETWDFSRYSTEYYTMLTIEKPTVVYDSEGAIKRFELSVGDKCAVSSRLYEYFYEGDKEKLHAICPGKGVGYLFKSQQNQSLSDTGSESEDSEGFQLERYIAKAIDSIIIIIGSAFIFLFIVMLLIAIFSKMVSEHYTARFEFVLLLCFSGLFFYGFGVYASIFQGLYFINEYHDTMIVLEESVPLYNDYLLTVPRGVAKQGSECIVSNTLHMQFFIDPFRLLTDKYEFFCNDAIGWGKLRPWHSPSVSNYKWVRVLFLSVFYGLILWSLYLFFSLIQSGILYLKEDPIRDNLIKDNAATDDTISDKAATNHSSLDKTDE